MKKVYQYHLDGTLKAEHDSVSSIATKLGVWESTIRRAANKNSISCGYLWSRDWNYFGNTNTVSCTEEHASDDVLKRSKALLIKNGYKLSKPKESFLERLKIANLYNLRGGESILIVGDLHLPFSHKDYLNHCIKVRDKFKCETIVFIGDMIDNHASSFHNTDPEGMGGKDEFEAALDEIAIWYKEFPNAYCCLGNHDEIPYRKAYKFGLPSGWLKEYSDAIRAPKTWLFGERFEINGAIFEHGTGSSGDMAAVNRARENRKSTIVGHSHSFSGIRYLASRDDTIFGMNVGCGIDEESYAISYGRFQARRPVISCGVVTDYGKNASVILL